MMLLLPAVASGTPTLNTIHHCDALTLLRALPAGSVDMIASDLPYGVTACDWDTPIDLVQWWEQVRRVLRYDGAFVTTASQPFASALIMSAPELFKYSWVWIKTRATDFIRAKLKPMGQHEDVLIFSQASVANGANMNMRYFPQGLRVVNRTEHNHSNTGGNGLRGDGARFLGRTTDNIGANNKLHQPTYIQEFEGYPSTLLRFFSVIDTVHPTQKPVALYEYLIRTYTQPGDVVLDPFMGSGTTALAARNTERKFIGCDLNADYVAMARRRLAQSDPYQSREVAPGLIQKSMFSGMSV